ncbi:MAG: DUF2244 domain-containing protein [Salibaculum sp.]|uniref:DUF2244 domain-containing protein n=1 Tax=Roseovarius halophilus (ex Wu et al. 2025) TaxID=3376060 RepID=UPI00286FB053|nr:DUF2244 domain-containing protein [Salibaculum sp.]MDR9427032.1 DUF2244 domain-containing protein [Salibaculum sp.]MDR9482755.1 DUF2244 domain-containing protein [Salibaculum sp.]
MPYEWTTPDSRPPRPGSPRAELHLWPYRSLLRRDFVIFISLTAALVLVPLLTVIGSPVLWGLLPFILLMLGGLWAGLSRSYRDGEILEELRLWPDRMELDRHDRKGGHRNWAANPYWVQVNMRQDGPVPNYVTLKGAGREVEVGAFLSEDERAALFDDLQGRLARLSTMTRSPGASDPGTSSPADP